MATMSSSTYCSLVSTFHNILNMTSEAATRLGIQRTLISGCAVCTHDVFDFNSKHICPCNAKSMLTPIFQKSVSHFIYNYVTASLLLCLNCLHLNMQSQVYTHYITKSDSNFERKGYTHET